jgi:hypothetical protein
MTKELLQQALDALESDPVPLNAINNASALLRAALAAPQPEPYGHVTTHTVTGQQFFYRYPSPPYLDTAKECIAVYAAPPAAPADMVMVPREPTPDMLQAALDDSRYGQSSRTLPTAKELWAAEQVYRAMIAAAPAPAVPLTDADIDRIADAVPVDELGVHITTWHRRFARAIEAHHGIGGGGNG